MDTAAGNPIDNAQTDEISQYELNWAKELLRKYPNVVIRTEDNPRYNCHGFTFGAGRSGIDRSPEVHKILEEDVYVEIADKDAQPGDHILYFGDGDDVEHSGIVVSTPVALPGIYRVVSKWGKLGQRMHWSNECPYDLRKIRYFRLK
jgi:hypothetical protein